MNPAPRGRLLAFLALLATLTMGLAVACRDAPAAAPAGRRHPPLVVVGIDGGEWRVIERLWREGKLPHLKALAERGVRARLRTAYNSSPVIWTTIATGVVPARHGITDFVVPTPQGDVPVSSTLRKVPALWNMASRTGRRVAALGWWGSWPAEPVRGVVVSDRALFDLPRRVSPPEYLPRFLADLRAADAEPSRFHRNDQAERQDHAMARSALRLAAERPDLLLLYFRSADVVSHNYWKFYEPELFAGVDPDEVAAFRDRIPQVYEAVDDAIGRLVAAVPPEANMIVLSDHGFHAAKTEQVKVLLDLDAVLERLGFLARGKRGIDFVRSRVYSYSSPNFRRARYLRYSLRGREPGGRVRPEERAGLRRELEAALATVTYENGAPVFFVRDARPKEAKLGADFVVGVSPDRGTMVLRIAGQPLRGAVEEIRRISGTHTLTTHGIFLAAGPDVDRGADLEGIDIHDMAPTILYGLGLPVAEDFAGCPRVTLFTAEFRRRNPLRKVATWGERKGGVASTSGADEKLLEDLRALGYIE